LAPLALGLFDLSLKHEAAAAPMHHHGESKENGAPPTETGAAQGTAANAANNTAQTGGQENTVADVVVVGHEDRGEERMEEVMMKTSRAGDVVTGTQATEQQFTTLNDYSQKVPAYRANITSPHFSRMSIRGLGTAFAGTTSSGYQSETGFVVDNVWWSQPEFQFGDWTNISSFEIGYGPSGTQGGHNTDVGSIYITTPLPLFVPKTQLETTIGNYAHVIQKFDTTGSINDNLAYRVSGYYDKAKGWIKDAGNGNDYNNLNRQGVRLQLLGVGDNFTDRFIIGFNNAVEKTYGEGSGGGNATAIIGDSFLRYANGTYPSSTYFQTFASRIKRPILTTNPYAPYLANNGPDFTRVVTASNELNYQIEKYTFTSISAFGYFSAPMYDCSDNQGVWIGTGSCSMDNYGLQGSQEFRLTSPRGEPLEWQVGLYSDYETNWARMHHWNYGPYAAAWLNNPAALPGLINWWNTRTSDTQIAVYGSATYHFTDQFTLTAGIRDSYDFRYMASTYVPQCVSGTEYTCEQQTAALIAGTGGGNISTGGHNLGHNGVTAIINPQYRINDDVMIYGLVGHGDKPPTANGTSGPIYSNGVFQGFTPFFNKSTYSMDYELGAKVSALDGQLMSNINLYWNDLWNFQTPQSILYTTTSGLIASQTYMGNAPHVRLRGVEFIERWTPNFAPGLELHASGAYTEARYISYPDAPAPVDYLYPGGPANVSLSNTRVTGVPWWSFNVGLDYSRPVGQVFRGLGESLHDDTAWTTASYEAFGYINANWFDHTQLTNPRSVYQYWQPAYTLVNLGAGLRTEDRNYAVTFWVKNLFDARPFTAFTVGTSTTPAAVSLTTMGPRYFGVSFLVTL